MLMTFLRVLDRQGMLKGDLNWTQRTGLAYLMGKEIEEDVAVERARMENTALATNPQTSGSYLEHLFSQREHEDEFESELRDEGYEIDWQTPTDPKEVEDVLRNLGLNVPS